MYTTEPTSVLQDGTDKEGSLGSFEGSTPMGLADQMFSSLVVYGAPGLSISGDPDH